MPSLEYGQTGFSARVELRQCQKVGARTRHLKKRNFFNEGIDMCEKELLNAV